MTKELGKEENCSHNPVDLQRAIMPTFVDDVRSQLKLNNLWFRWSSVEDFVECKVRVISNFIITRYPRLYMKSNVASKYVLLGRRYDARYESSAPNEVFVSGECANERSN